MGDLLPQLRALLTGYRDQPGFKITKLWDTEASHDWLNQVVQHMLVAQAKFHVSQGSKMNNWVPSCSCLVCLKKLGCLPDQVHATMMCPNEHNVQVSLLSYSFLILMLGFVGSWTSIIARCAAKYIEPRLSFLTSQFNCYTIYKKTMLWH